jgi:hypothetical protein
MATTASEKKVIRSTARASDAIAIAHALLLAAAGPTGSRAAGPGDQFHPADRSSVYPGRPPQPSGQRTVSGSLPVAPSL